MKHRRPRWMMPALVLLAVMALSFRFWGPSKPSLPPATKNVLRNSAFTVQTNPGIPDWWSNSSGTHLPDWPACWTPDKEVFVPGTLSMKMTNPADRPGNTMQSYGHPATIGKVYVASVYLKSDVPDAPVNLNVSGLGSKTFKVGTAWTRYCLAGAVKKPKESSARFFFTLGWSKKGTLWVNAPQIEEAAAVPAKPDAKPAADQAEIKLADGSQAFVGPPGPYGTSPKDTPTTPGKEEPKAAKAPAGSKPSFWHGLASFFGLGAPSVPSATCPATDAAPKIDGVLDDPCWKNAAHLDNFILYDGPDPAKNQTDVYITRDDKALYIAARCHDSDMAHLKGDCQTRDGQVFSDDEIEVFLSPFKDGKDYYQFAVNLVATKFDGHVKDASWDADWEAWTGREDKAWTLEMAIPFKALGLTPTASKTWRINICRHRANPSGEEYSTWSRVNEQFHSPEHFGKLEGMEPSAFDRYFVDVKPEAILPTADPALMDLKLNVTNLAKTFRRLEGEAEMDGGKDLRQAAKFPVLLQAHETKSVTIPNLHALQEGKKYRLIIRLANEGSHEPVLARVMNNARSLLLAPERPLSARFEYSFVTDEPRCALVIGDTQDEQARKAARLNVQLRLEGSPASIASWSFSALQPVTPIPVDTRKMPLGAFEASAELLNAEGRLVDRARAVFAKLPPKPNQVKVNRDSMSLIVGGKDYIPFAMGISYDSKQGPDSLRDIAAHGCDGVTIVFNSSRLKDEEIKEGLDLCQSLGLKVVYWMHYETTKGYQAIRDDVVRVTEKFKDHPALVAWYMIDEPEGWWSKAGTEADLLDMYNAIRKADPHHPVFTNHCGGWKRGYGGYGGLESTDINSFDTYPIGRTPKAMDQIVKVVDDMAWDGARDGKPVAFWCQFYGSYDSPREPTPAENVCQTYLCLIHKARLIFYFVYKPMYPKLYDSLKPLGDEVRKLTPILVHTIPADGVTSSAPALHFCLSQQGAKRHLIAVNATDQQIKGTFYFSAPQPVKAGGVKVLFEDRAFSWNGKKLKDAFEPYQRHVYEME